MNVLPTDKKSQEKQ